MRKQKLEQNILIREGHSFVNIYIYIEFVIKDYLSIKLSRFNIDIDDSENLYKIHQ